MDIIEEKADEMGTGMENIKVMLRQPSARLIISDKPSSGVPENKLLYRPQHLNASEVPRSVDVNSKKY